jgi:ADP-ribosylglycohydrolase
LVGDALGVPYEHGKARAIPRSARLEMNELGRRLASHPVPTGTWSDDGAAALVVLEVLGAHGGLDLEVLARRLYDWMTSGALTVDGHVFDIGIQTAEALGRFQRGVPARQCGLAGVRNNGNGALVRALPLALDPRLDTATLARAAAEQSRITHAHPRALLCASLYALWARATLELGGRAASSEDAWRLATDQLRALVAGEPELTRELEREVRPAAAPWGTGSGYVVDSLHSARWACQADDYEQVVTRAIELGNDTDTTAALAGAVAGLRFGLEGIPGRWRAGLRGAELAERLVASFALRVSPP